MRTRLGMLVVAAACLMAAAPPVAAQENVAHFVVLAPKYGSLAQMERSVRDAGGAVLQRWPQIGVVIATSPDTGFAAAVRRKPGVSAAGATRNLVELALSPEPPARIEAVPEVATRAAAGMEPLEPNQWNLRQIGADRAGGGSRDVLVGVLDSGVDASHPDLAANFDAASSVGCLDDGVPDTSPAAWLPPSVEEMHGTHVAGIIAAARNGIGVAGVPPNVRVASVRVTPKGATSIRST